MTTTPDPTAETPDETTTETAEGAAVESTLDATAEQLDDAQTAYAAYGQSTGGLNFRGEPMPTWDGLGAPIQQAWVAAAAAVRERAERDARARLL